MKLMQVKSVVDFLVLAVQRLLALILDFVMINDSSSFSISISHAIRPKHSMLNATGDQMKPIAVM